MIDTANLQPAQGLYDMILTNSLGFKTRLLTGSFIIEAGYDVISNIVQVQSISIPSIVRVHDANIVSVAVQGPQGPAGNVTGSLSNTLSYPLEVQNALITVNSSYFPTSAASNDYATMLHLKGYSDNANAAAASSAYANDYATYLASTSYINVETIGNVRNNVYFQTVLDAANSDVYVLNINAGCNISFATSKVYDELIVYLNNATVSPITWVSNIAWLTEFAPTITNNSELLVFATNNAWYRSKSTSFNSNELYTDNAIANAMAYFGNQLVEFSNSNARNITTILAFPVAYATTYKIEGQFLVQGNIASNIKFDFNKKSGLANAVLMYRADYETAPFGASPRSWNNVMVVPLTNNLAMNSIYFVGTLYSNGSSGILEIRAAQNVASTIFTRVVG